MQNVVYLTSIWLFLIGICSYIIRKYANNSVFPLHTYITVFLQYLCAFGIVLMIPLDLSITLSGRQNESKLDYYYNSIFSTLLDYFNFK